jgi:phage terminase large subunit
MEKFITAFGANKCAIVPQSRKSDQISAAREVMPRCEFHKDRCEDGLDGLTAWEYEYNEDTGIFSREPLHNWASHPADAFCYGAQVMQEIKPKEPEKPHVFSATGHNGRIVTAPLDDLWRDTAKRVERF